MKAMGRPAADFYEIQGTWKKKSLAVFAVIMLFYSAGIGLLALVLTACFGLILGAGIMRVPHFWPGFFVLVTVVSGLIAFVQFRDARRNGAGYILRRLQAVPPDMSDRCHIEFANILEEMRLAAGLPAVQGLVLPFMAMNSLALIEPDGTPVVVVTEGLLAAGTRDELQAAVAHELAHIIRGDALYVALVCSLAGLFEKIRSALEPDDDSDLDGIQNPGLPGRRRRSGYSSLLLPAAAFAGLVMRVLTGLISRQREFLADAAAVELCRSPESLARILVKAGLSNSFIGDFSASYAPLFMVNPLADLSSGSRLLQTHPPVQERVTVLAEMAHKKPEELIDDIRAAEHRRENARTVVRPRALFSPWNEDIPEAPAVTSPREAPVAGNAPPERVWLIRTAGNAWDGPLTTEELIDHPRFFSFAMVRNSPERIEAKAREFPQLRTAMRKKAAGQGTAGDTGDHRCPRCKTMLVDSVYEGVPVMTCHSCGGRLVGMGGMDRIIIRKETAFSEGFRKKAGEYRTSMKHGAPPADRPSLKRPSGKAACPCCGRPMIERPFNYEYFIPVDKCLTCCKMWFDTDELELLQYLVESRAERA